MEGIKWVDVPNYEEEYKAAMLGTRPILYTKRKNRVMQLNVSYSLSKKGKKQIVVSEKRLMEMCGFERFVTPVAPVS